MEYSQSAAKEPIEIRAHHLFQFADFMLHRPSVGALLRNFGPNAGADNFNGYGRQFAEHEVETWDYLANHPQARVKITDQHDTLCGKCGNREKTCYGDPSRWDNEAAEILTVEIGEIYTVKQLVALLQK